MKVYATRRCVICRRGGRLPCSSRARDAARPAASVRRRTARWNARMAALQEEHDAQAGVAVSIVFDDSGSMNDNHKLAMAKQAFRAWIEHAPDNYRFGLVALNAGVLVPLQRNDRRKSSPRSTACEPGAARRWRDTIARGGAEIRQRRAAGALYERQVVVILTDGEDTTERGIEGVQEEIRSLRAEPRGGHRVRLPGRGRIHARQRDAFLLTRKRAGHQQGPERHRLGDRRHVGRGGGRRHPRRHARTSGGADAAAQAVAARRRRRRPPAPARRFRRAAPTPPPVACRPTPCAPREPQCRRGSGSRVVSFCSRGFARCRSSTRPWQAPHGFRPMKKTFSILLVLATLAMIGWGLSRPWREAHRTADLFARTSDTRQYKRTVTIWGDDWLGYLVLRSPRFARALADKDIGVRWEMEPDFEKRLAGLRDGKCDFVAATLDSYLTNGNATGLAGRGHVRHRRELRRRRRAGGRERQEPRRPQPARHARRVRGVVAVGVSAALGDQPFSSRPAAAGAGEIARGQRGHRVQRAARQTGGFRRALGAAGHAREERNSRRARRSSTRARRRAWSSTSRWPGGNSSTATRNWSATVTHAYFEALHDYLNNAAAFTDAAAHDSGKGAADAETMLRGIRFATLDDNVQDWLLESRDQDARLAGERAPDSGDPARPPAAHRPAQRRPVFASSTARRSSAVAQQRGGHRRRWRAARRRRTTPARAPTGWARITRR